MYKSALRNVNEVGVKGVTKLTNGDTIIYMNRLKEFKKELGNRELIIKTKPEEVDLYEVSFKVVRHGYTFIVKKTTNREGLNYLRSDKYE